MNKAPKKKRPKSTVSQDHHFMSVLAHSTTIRLIPLINAQVYIVGRLRLLKICTHSFWNELNELAILVFTGIEFQSLIPSTNKVCFPTTRSVRGTTNCLVLVDWPRTRISLKYAGCLVQSTLYKNVMARTLKNVSSEQPRNREMYDSALLHRPPTKAVDISHNWFYRIIQHFPRLVIQPIVEYNAAIVEVWQ